MTKIRNETPTLKTIAEAANVSVAAVSKVLNNRIGVGKETRTRVMAVIDDLGYQGRSGRAGKLQAVSLITLGQFITNDAFYGDILDSITTHGARSGLDVQLNVFDTAEDFLNTPLPGHGAHPALLVGLDQPDVIDALVARGKPTVIVNGMDRSMRLSSASPDYHFGGWLATRHLLDLGHTEIMHITHPHRETLRRRIDGFRNAMEETGIPFDPARHILNLGTPDSISAAVRDLVCQGLKARDKMPTALFCINDLVALGTMQALQSMGLSVPNDVSVVGFDGLSVSQFTSPPLTTVRSDRGALGRMAVTMLSEEIRSPALPVRRVAAAVEIIERNSTAPVRVLK